MKLLNQIKRCCLLLLLFVGSKFAMAQPYPNTGDHTVCLNAVEPYGVILTPGSTYSWTITPITTGNGTITVGATPNLITVHWTSVGTATLQVIETNAQGCPGDPVTIIVTINPLPTLIITNPSVCGSGTADLTAASVTAGSSAGLTFTYWQDAAATIPYATPTAAPAGTYYIKATSAGGCSDIKPVTVTSTAAPTLVITNPSVCGSGTADLTAASVTAGSTGGLTFTYWQDAAATIPYATPTAAPAGTYYIQGTLVGGCSNIKPVVVTANSLPTPAISGPTPVCVSANGATSQYTTASVAGHTYVWTVTGGTITAGQNTNQISVSWTTAGAGVVSVTETITATGCSANASSNITVNPKPVTSPITHN